MRRALSLLVVAQACGQYNGLFTTLDGNTLIFSTELRQNETDQPAWGKLFVHDASGLRPFLIRNRDVPSIFRTNAYDVRTGILSPDGKWLAITGRAECHFTSGVCSSTDENETTLYDSDGISRLTVRGSVRFSANSRWLAVHVRPFVTATLRLFDLTTLTEVDLVPQPRTVTEPTSLLGVTDDGLVLYAGYQREIWLFGPIGHSRRVSAAAITGVISADGKTIVTGQANRLILLNEAGERDMGEGEPLALTSDGRKLLVRRIGQLWTVSVPGGEARRLTNEDVQAVTMSGDGSTVYYTTTAGTIMRVSTADAVAVRLIAPIAVPDVQRYSLALPYTAYVTPGEPVRARWSAPPGAGEQPTVQVAGYPAPVLQTETDSFTFQVPWETPPADATEITIRSAAQHTVWRTEWPVPARVATTFARLVALVHQDFNAVVTHANPARPGEILHAYALGLGPVVQPPQTGEPAQLATPLVRPLNCNATVLYAGLAPGFVGYYQVDFVVPEQPLFGYGSLSCDLPGFTFRLPVRN